MKKILSILSITAFAFVLIPVISKAQEGSAPANPPAPENVQAAPTNMKPGQRPPLTNMPLIRDEIRKKVEAAKDNKDVRNKLIPNPNKGPNDELRAERKALASTTREEIKNIRDEEKDMIRAASSTKERREIMKEARNDVFKAKQDKLVQELTLSLNNLKQIRTRISNRIDKAASEGRNMTEPKKLLVGADQKISVAEEAIKTLSTMKPPAPPARTATTTGENQMVNLEKPRQIGEDAIKKVGVARIALNEVVVSIAKNMGQQKEKPPVPPATPSVTPTTTASPSPTQSSLPQSVQ